MTTAFKYTDRDVREQPELVAEAVRYLRWYQGEFDFLLDAKRFEAANGYISIATARGVLNCMRHDLRYLSIETLTPPHSHSPRYAEHPAGDGSEPYKRKRRLRLVDDEDLRYPFDLKTYWNARIMYSTHKTAVTAHVLKPNIALRYFPATGEIHFPIMRALCSTSYYRTTALSRAVPEGRRFCRRCAEALAELSEPYDWAKTTPPVEVTVGPTEKETP